MRSTRSQFLFVALIGSIIMASRLAAQNNVAMKQLHINLTEADGFVARYMTVTRSTGEPTPGLRTIESFDGSTDTFTFVEAAGGTVQMPISQIAAIDFKQELARQSMMAQEPAWNITVQHGVLQTIEIRPEDLHISDGMLTVGVADTSPFANSTDVVEATHLSFDRQKNVIVLSVQPVSYQKSIVGGGGASGLRKGLQ